MGENQMGDLLKEAIADAKAVRETALQNAKMALEEAFTPQLKSMLSAKSACKTPPPLTAPSPPRGNFPVPVTQASASARPHPPRSKTPVQRAPPTVTPVLSPTLTARAYARPAQVSTSESPRKATAPLT